MNPMQILMNQLSFKNPGLLNQFQNIMRSQNDPINLLNSMIGKYTPEQMNGFVKFANSFGISNDQLSKYGINAK